MKKKVISIVTLIILVYQVIYPSLISYAEDDYTNLVIPEGTIEIEQSAYKNKGIETLELPNSLKIIGDYAFEPNKIKTIKFGNSLIKIGDSAFQDNEIEELQIPDSVEEIVKSAFWNNKLKTLTLGKSVKTIGINAFGHNQLEEVEIPATVEKIGDSCFYENNLKKVTILNKDLEIGWGAFNNQTDMASLTIYGYEGSTAQAYANEHGVKFEVIKEDTGGDENPDTGGGENLVEIGGIIYSYDKESKTAAVKMVKEDAINNSEKKLIIPSTITTLDGNKYTVQSISSGAVDIDGICGIQIPETVIGIYENAFTKYKGNVYIHKKMKYFDINAFSSREANIYFYQESLNDNEFFTHDYGYLWNKDNTIFYGTTRNIDGENIEFVIPDTVVQIGERAFKYFTNLSSVQIGINVTNIAADTFDGIEDKVKILGYPGSYAENYATAHGIKFEAIGYIGEDINRTSQTKFLFDVDNYNFVNSQPYFSSYKIGDFKDYLTNSLYEHAIEKEKKSWSGSCGGMALTDLLFKYRYLSQDYWQSNGVFSKKAQYTHDLDNTMTNKNLRWLINFYWMFWWEIIDSGSFLEIKGEGDSDIEKLYNGLNAFYDDIEHENDTLLCEIIFDEEEFEWDELFWQDTKTTGHAVLINARPEKLDENFYKEHKKEFDDFGYRIPIYDVNYKNQRYIYISKDFSYAKLGTDSNITWPAWGLNEKKAERNDTKCWIYNIRAWKINPSGVFCLEDVIRRGKEVSFSKLKTIRYKYDSLLKISNEYGEYMILKNSNLIDQTLNGVVEPIIGITTNQADEEFFEGIHEAEVLFEEGDYYTIETQNDTDELDVSMQFGDSYMTVKTKSGGKAIFENKKSLTLSNPSGQEYEMKFTLNKEFTTLPWFTIMATGTEAKNMKLEMTEEGAIISGDNLKNILVKGSNREEQTELSISTDKKSVLIKANSDETKLLAYIDTDGDGTDETLIGEADSQAIPEESKDEIDNQETENNIEEDNSSSKKASNIKTGDMILYMVFILVTSIIVFVVTIIVKYFKK